jgi:hypothetical protein
VKYLRRAYADEQTVMPSSGKSRETEFCVFGMQEKLMANQELQCNSRETEFCYAAWVHTFFSSSITGPLAKMTLRPGVWSDGNELTELKKNWAVIWAICARRVSIGAHTRCITPLGPKAGRPWPRRTCTSTSYLTACNCKWVMASNKVADATILTVWLLLRSHDTTTTRSDL